MKSTPAFRSIFLLTVIFFGLRPFVHAQTPAKCLEIESILVDACVPGTGCTSAASPSCSCEGKNEMVRFKIGPSNINVSDLDITWPNNSFLGISPANATTAALVSTLNGTILSCGHLLEPTAGVLPAGKTILLITSTEMCTTANSFANLSDTIYVIFQNAGNYQGHFVNYSSTPGIRTTIFRQISTGCADTVTYDKSLLVNQLGGYGGSSALNDGATVNFSWPGVATYVNKGCTAPLITNTADAGTGGSICASGSINLSGTATGSYTGVIWSGGSGSFGTPTNASTTYTPGPADSGTLSLSFGVIGHCHDTVFSTVNVSILPPPTASISFSGSASICPGNSITLNASGGGTYSWSTGSTASSITVNSAGTYTVTVSNSCGSVTDTQSVFMNPLPVATITPSGPTTFCAGNSVNLTASGTGSFSWSTGSTAGFINASTAGTYILTATNSCGSDTAQISVATIAAPNAALSPSGSTTLCSGDNLTLTAAGGGSYLWSNGSSGSSINVNSAGNYYVVVSNSCGNDTASVTVGVDPVNALFGSDATSGSIPLTIHFNNSSSSGTPANYNWDFGNGQTSTASDPTTTYTAAGVYTVVLTVTNSTGCTDTYTMTVYVNDTPSSLTIPNTFSPNGDGNNDNYWITSQNIAEFHCSIYDRWGLLIKELGNVNEQWEGKTESGKTAPDGTYYYLISAKGLDGKSYDLKGFIQVIR